MLGDGPGIFPMSPFPLSRPIKSPYEEQSRKGPRHNLDHSPKNVGNTRVWKPLGLASLKKGVVSNSWFPSDLFSRVLFPLFAPFCIAKCSLAGVLDIFHFFCLEERKESPRSWGGGGAEFFPTKALFCRARGTAHGLKGQFQVLASRKGCDLE